MRVLAPAKINLHLRVGRPRADGFHPLLTWMCTIGLFDTLDFERAGQDAFSLVQKSGIPVPVDQQNLVVKAAAALAEVASPAVSDAAAKFAGVLAGLNKQIPVGAGLGGGSSDAARTIVALNRLLRLELSQKQLKEAAARVGSDVAFFLEGPSAVCRGRGEKVERIASPAAKWCVLVLPEFGLSTPAVYRRYDEMGLGSTEALTEEPDWSAWTKLPAGELMQRLENNLEPAAFSIRPELEELRSSVERKLGRLVRMSGSGSSLFALFDEQDMASSAAAAAQQSFAVTAMAVEVCPQWKDDLA